MKKSQHIGKLIIAFCLVFSGFEGIFAQQNTVTTGGNAYGTGGSVSYSIGQVDYETGSGPGGNITQGLQQPYKIIVVSGIEETDINLTISVYPNPTTDFVILDVQNANTQNMTYLLYDIQGKLLEKQNINGNQTIISMSELAVNNYFIKVLNNRAVVKTFKVIKNK